MDVPVHHTIQAASIAQKPRWDAVFHAAGWLCVPVRHTILAGIIVNPFQTQAKPHPYVLKQAIGCGFLFSAYKQTEQIRLVGRPVGVEAAGFVGALVRMGAEIIALGLDQVCWQ